MSADYWLEWPEEVTEKCHGDHSWNCTYNLGAMLREAGFPAWNALAGAPAVEAAGVLDGVARTLRADPDRFKQMNPPNGWGDYDGAIRFVEAMRDGCREHPSARIGAWL